MISEEQKELASYIKAVHLSLRCKSRQVGAELAWKEHKENEEVLRNYATRMKTLAEDYWSVRNDSDECSCRIRWVANAVADYFDRGGLAREAEKERTKLARYAERGLVRPCGELGVSGASFREPYKLLDVGSCYDPFGAYPAFETYPIDLCPAVPRVKKCDFTEVEVRDVDGEWFRDDDDDVRAVPANHFDVVVFSLYLEYLPSPEQRFASCEKAYEALKPGGLLVIITPDSSHESANAGIMKRWKLALAWIGFARVKLEKLRYIYCMSYRKAMSREYSKILCGVAESPRAMPIPQDFVDYAEKVKPARIANETDAKEAFEALPFS